MGSVNNTGQRDHGSARGPSLLWSGTPHLSGSSVGAPLATVHCEHHQVENGVFWLSAEAWLRDHSLEPKRWPVFQQVFQRGCVTHYEARALGVRRPVFYLLQQVLGVLLEELLTWVRSLPGSRGLRALVVFDEVYGFLPPHPNNPPTKRPLVQLMKQARAFGVGVLMWYVESLWRSPHTYPRSSGKRSTPLPQGFERHFQEEW